MLAAAAKALAQMFSPEFRAVLLKAMGLALVVLVALGVGVQRLIAWLAHYGGAWLQATFSALGGGVVGWLEWTLTLIASLGLIVAMVFLMPAVTGLIAGVFADDIAEQVERTHYPAQPIGKPLPRHIGLFEGVKAALLGIGIYLCALPFLLVAGLGAALFFLAAAWLLGREYFHLAAMRHRPPAEARALRKRYAGTVFRAGMLIAAFVSVPILNLATPLFATALMVHMHKRLTESPAAPGSAR